MCCFEILKSISCLPALLWGSPLHRGDSLPSWRKGTKSPLGYGTPEGLCLPPTEPGTMPICWVPPGLGLKLLPHFPCTARGRSGTRGTATPRASSPEPSSCPAGVLILGTGRASPPCPPAAAGGSHWEPLQSQLGHTGVARSRGVHGHLLPPAHRAPWDAAVPCAAPGPSHIPSLR